MTSRICAVLISIAGLMGLAQVPAGAQAILNSTDSQFGTEPAPYSQRAQSNQGQRGIPVAQPVNGSGAYVPGGYAPGGYAPGGYAPGGYAPQQDSGSFGAPDPTKPLGRGDTVSFSIAQDREPAQLMRVTDTGELDFSVFPKIGRISVVGRTCAQVASELKHKLEADYYNHADVMLGINQVNIHGSSGTVYVTGNVMIPGPQELPSNQRTTVSTVIIRAGGFSKYANQHKVKVTRKDKTSKTISFNVDVAAIINGGHLDKDVEVLDGDYINVPQNFINY